MIIFISCRLPISGDNLKTLVLALSASMTACGIVGDGVPWVTYHSVVQYVADISVTELYYKEVTSANSTVSTPARLLCTGLILHEMHLLSPHVLSSGISSSVTHFHLQQGNATVTSCPDGADCDAVVSFMITPSTSEDWYRPSAVALWYAANCAVRTSSLQVSDMTVSPFCTSILINGAVAVLHQHMIVHATVS